MIEIKKRTGVKLIVALIKTIPSHYRILKKDNGRKKSFYFSIRLAFSRFLK